MTKTHFKTKLTAFFLIFVLLIPQTSAAVLAASVLPTDVSTAESGNVLVGISGTYESVSTTKILDRINQIRKEACTNGYINPATGQKLKSSDYVPIKWSENLWWIASLRAAECTVNESHTRPNGNSCFSIQHDGEQSWAENLAWNYSGLMHGIEQWYREKNDWVTQNASAVTGHYTHMINPKYEYIGLGCFRRDSGGWYGIAAEFGYSTDGSLANGKNYGKAVQTIEVKKSAVKNAKLVAPSSIKVKKTKKLSVSCNVTFPGIMGGKNTSKGTITKGITWKSSKPSVLSVNKNGRITAKKAGTATITAKVKGGITVKKRIKVKK